MTLTWPTPERNYGSSSSSQTRPLTPFRSQTSFPQIRRSESVVLDSVGSTLAGWKPAPPPAWSGDGRLEAYPTEGSRIQAGQAREPGSGRWWTTGGRLILFIGLQADDVLPLNAEFFEAVCRNDVVPRRKTGGQFLGLLRALLNIVLSRFQITFVGRFLRIVIGPGAIVFRLGCLLRIYGRRRGRGR